MKIFLTGATGFLGEKVTLALLNDGHDVFALVRDLTKVGKTLGSSPRFHAVKGDLFHLGETPSTCDAVFHLAGLISYKNEDRAALEQVNVEGTRSVLAACSPGQPFVFTSSVVAVGANENSDEAPLNELSAYRLGKYDLGYYETKRKAEELVKAAHESGLVRAIIYNPSSTFGAGDVLKGSRSIHLKVARGQMPFYCDGGVSVVHVDDCVSAILEGFRRKKFGERYILSGENLTILQMNELISEIAGQKRNFHKIPRWVLRLLGQKRDRFLSMTLYHWFDHSKASQHLDFQPRAADLAFRESLGWAKQNGYLS